MPTAPRRTRTPLTALFMVGAVLALLLGGAGTASAHAVITRSDPADVSVLKTAPKQVTLTFNESVSLADGSLRVLSPKNLRVDRGTVAHAAGKTNTARVTLAGKLPEGTYTVSWRVVSSDGHPISGAFTFSIGQPSTTTAPVPAESRADTATSRPYGVFRYVAYGGLALLIGVALFALVCWPAGASLRPLRRLVLTGWAALFASTVVLLLLRGPYETGKGLSAVFDLSLLGRTLTGRSGWALGARLLLLLAAGILLARFASRLRREADKTPRDPATAPTTDQPAMQPQFGVGVRAVGALFAVGLALTWAAAEHASAGLQVPLAIPVSVLHLLAMAVWLGGLIALVVALFRAPADTMIPPTAIARFSRLAFAAVAVLVTTGLYQSWRQIGSLEALSTTEYGRLLVLKSIAVVVVLTVAAFSRQWTAQLIQEQPQKESVPAAEPQRVRVAQTVGVGASSSGDITEGSDSTAGPPAPRDPADDPGPSDFDRHRRGLRRSVAVEAVLGVVVLAITTMLTGTQPSRAAAQSAAALAEAQEPTAQVAVIPFDVGTPKGNGRVQITFAPGRVGDNTVEALVYDSGGFVAAVPELRLTLTQQAQRIGPLDAKLADRGGYWSTDRLRLPLPGTWTLRVTVRITDIDQVTVSQDVTIKPSPI
ncbi:copper resistance protein CopC [Streptomyces iakyrus]|uniref:copper resistance CopC/CopD family protein n=1 Tax=Streptomyces iakyrus TaxID=68219 RepID=UPI000AE49127|nr:copper resistance protein CopC [Streptomyces iakyrus]